MHVLFIQNVLFYRFIGYFLLEFDNYTVIYVFHFFFTCRVNSKTQNSFTDASAVFPLRTNSFKFKNPQIGSSAYLKHCGYLYMQPCHSSHTVLN